MKISTKAYLYTTFLIPGAGQWVLKRYRSSIAMMVIALISIAYVFIKVMIISLSLVDQIKQGSLGADVFAIRELIKAQLSNSQADTLNLIILVFVIVWIVSIVDIYRLSRKGLA